MRVTKSGVTGSFASRFVAAMVFLVVSFPAFAQTTATFGEKQIGKSCGNLANDIDFDTITQCNTSNASGGLYQKAPLFVGAVTSPPYAATTCDSNKNGMIQYNGAVMQYCNGSGWTTLAAGSLGTAASATNPSRSDDTTTGLFSATASTVSIATAGTARLIVTATGSLGIGTATPGNALDVNGSIRSNNEIIGNGLNGGSGQFRMIYGSYGSFLRNDGADTYLLMTNSGDQYGSWNSLRPLIVHNSSGYVTLGNGTNISSPSDVPLRLGYSSYGTWLVGPDVNNNFVIYNSAIVGLYVGNGSQSWTAGSDRRLKKNIETVSVLDKLDKYRAVSFDWKKTGKHDLGVIAQEFYPIFPELVDKGSDDPYAEVEMGKKGTWGVMYDKIGALALEGVKELYEKLQALIDARESDTLAIQKMKAEIAALKSENAGIRARLDTIETSLKSRNP